MATATMPDYGPVPRTSVEIHGVTFTRHPLSEKWPDMGRDQFAELVTDLDLSLIHISEPTRPY